MTYGASTVEALVDTDVKQEAARVLYGIGLTASDALRLLPIRVAEDHRVPFEIKRPNAVTAAALLAAERGEVERFPNAKALFDDLGI